MASFPEPEIPDPGAQSEIAVHRRSPGVHIYLDDPHGPHLKSWIFSTTVFDLTKVKSKTFDFAFLGRCLHDDPQFALGIKNYDQSMALELGNRSYPYASIKKGAYWYPVKFDMVDPSYKTGDFVAFSLHISNPQHDNSDSEITFSHNGHAGESSRMYESSYDVTRLAETMFYHTGDFSGMSILECHFVYEGITEARQQAANNIISVHYDSLVKVADVSEGGSAVITGSYLPVDSSINGIMIGYFINSQNTHVFSGQKDPSKVVTFRMTFTSFGVWVVTEGERTVINGEPLNYRWAEIIVQNMNIMDIEIHTGAKWRGKSS